MYNILLRIIGSILSFFSGSSNRQQNYSNNVPMVYSNNNQGYPINYRQEQPSIGFIEILGFIIKVVSIYIISSLALKTVTKTFFSNKSAISGHSSSYTIIFICIIAFMLIVPKLGITMAPLVLVLFLVLATSTTNFARWKPFKQSYINNKELLAAELVISKGSRKARSRLLAETMDGMKPYLNSYKLLDGLGDNTINSSYANYTPLMRAVRNRDKNLVRHICKSSKIDPFQKANGWKIPYIEFLPTIGGVDNINYTLFESRNIEIMQIVIAMGIHEGYIFTSKQIEKMIDLDIKEKLIREASTLTKNINENIMGKVKSGKNAPAKSFMKTTTKTAGNIQKRGISLITTIKEKIWGKQESEKETEEAENQEKEEEEPHKETDEERYRRQLEEGEIYGH